MNQQVQDYIRKSIEAGFSDEQIKQELKKVGWQEQDINQAFAGMSFSASSTPKFKRNKSKVFLIIIIVIISIIIIAGIIFVYKYFKPSSDEYNREREEREINVSGLPASKDAENNQVEDKEIQEIKIQDCGRARLVKKTKTGLSSSEELSMQFGITADVPETTSDREVLKCFDNAFMNCQPSKIEYDMNGEITVIETIGEKDSMCVFSMKDAKNPSDLRTCTISKNLLSESKEDFLKGVNDNTYEEGTFFMLINFTIAFTEAFEDFPDNTEEQTTDDITDYIGCE